MRQQSDTISRFNDFARISNDTVQKGPKYSPTSGFLLCALCEGEVKRRIGKSKNRIVQIGFQTVTVGQYKCSVCGSCYSGFPPHIKSDDNPDLEAEIVQYSGVRQ